MITGSLAIYNEDLTGTAAKLLTLAVPGAQKNCAQAVQSDGTWTETPAYWCVHDRCLLLWMLL